MNLFKKKKATVATQEAAVNKARAAFEAAQEQYNSIAAALRAMPNPSAELGRSTPAQWRVLQARYADAIGKQHAAHGKVQAAEAALKASELELERLRSIERERSGKPATKRTTGEADALQRRLAEVVERLAKATTDAADINAEYRKAQDAYTEADKQRNRATDAIARAEAAAAVEMAQKRASALFYQTQDAARKCSALAGERDAIEQELRAVQSRIAAAQALYDDTRAAAQQVVTRLYNDGFVRTMNNLRDVRGAVREVVGTAREKAQEVAALTGEDPTAFLSRDGVHIADIEHEIVEQIVRAVVEALGE